MEIGSDDESYLRASIADGDGLLILGAGCSVTSLNARNEPVKSAEKLAEVLASRAGLPYAGERLVDVLSAVRGSILSDQQIRDILIREYKGVTPSKELQDLFAYTWRRVYTWNIDDAIENINKRSAQTRRPYNGMVDKAADLEVLNFLHVVSLHGQITKPDHGFILTEVDYATHIKSEKHYWYQRTAQDYLAFCPIFIGSKLDEPILMAELERAKRESNSVAGKAFLFTPDKLSTIQKGALKSKGIVHVQGTLADFVDWLAKNFPKGLNPQEILAKSNNYRPEDLSGLSREDLLAASSLKVVDPIGLKSTLRQMSDADKGKYARQFLRGFPPTWLVAASDIPVELAATRDLYKSLEDAIGRNDRLFVVVGQSGSGKTTATMMTILKYVEEHNDVSLFELKGDVRSVRRAFNVLRKFPLKKRTIVYIGDLFLYGDSLKDDLESLIGQEVIIVSTARSGEWNEHLSRRYGNYISPVVYERFVRRDFDPLIDRLISYVPAPTFRKLTRHEQHDKLGKSKSQLLIALREATESENFTDVITHEFQTLPDDDTRKLMLIVGVATLARTGISKEAAFEAYGSIANSRKFDDAMSALEGIVAMGEDRRLHARHELYVRHVIEKVANFDEFRAVIKAILRTYLKYDIPIVKFVNRLDGTLFRFLLNHKVVAEHAKHHHDLEGARDIYSEFEVDFQLDGHFWLQYGLYLAEMGEINLALDMLRKSIQAYPENIFAVHALADVQLRAAKERKVYDAITRDLIGQAVETLTGLDARNDLRIDLYPIVTLARGHISALVAHNQREQARTFAKRYFDRLSQLERSHGDEHIRTAKEKMLRFVTLDEWPTGWIAEERRSSGRAGSA